MRWRRNSLFMDNDFWSSQLLLTEKEWKSSGIEKTLTKKQQNPFMLININLNKSFLIHNKMQQIFQTFSSWQIDVQKFDSEIGRDFSLFFQKKKESNGISNWENKRCIAISKYEERVFSAAYSTAAAVSQWPLQDCPIFSTVCEVFWWTNGADWGSAQVMVRENGSSDDQNGPLASNKEHRSSRSLMAVPMRNSTDISKLILLKVDSDVKG